MVDRSSPVLEKVLFQKDEGERGTPFRPLQMAVSSVIITVDFHHPFIHLLIISNRRHISFPNHHGEITVPVVVGNSIIMGGYRGRIFCCFTSTDHPIDIRFIIGIYVFASLCRLSSSG
jgi:hypothetical protein